MEKEKYNIAKEEDRGRASDRAKREAELERAAEERMLKERYRERYINSLKERAEEPLSKPKAEAEEEQSFEHWQEVSARARSEAEARRAETEDRFSAARELLLRLAKEQGDGVRTESRPVEREQVAMPAEKAKEPPRVASFAAEDTPTARKAAPAFEYESEVKGTPAVADKNEDFVYKRSYDKFSEGRLTLPRIDFTYGDLAATEGTDAAHNSAVFIPIHRGGVPTVIQGARIERAEPPHHANKEELTADEAFREAEYSASSAFTDGSRDYGFSSDCEPDEGYPTEVSYAREPEEYRDTGYIYQGGESDVDVTEEINYAREHRVNFDYGLDDTLEHSADYHTEVNYAREPEEYRDTGYIYQGGESDVDVTEEINYAREHKVNFDYGLDDTLEHSADYHTEVSYAREPEEYRDTGYIYQGGESDVDVTEEINYAREHKVNFDYGLDYSLEIGHDADYDYGYEPPYQLTRDDTYKLDGFDYSYDATTDLAVGEEHNLEFGYNLGVEGDGSDFVFLPSAPDRREQKREIEEEYIRYLKESRRRDKELKERSASAEERESGEEHYVSLAEGAPASASRSVEVVEKRFIHHLRELEYKRRMKLMTFGTSEDKIYSEVKALDKKIYKLRSKRKRALRAEKKASLRYYAVLENSTGAYGRCRDPEKLNDIFRSLDALLLERDEINGRLIQLYNGSPRAKKSKLDDKAMKVRTRAARSVYRSQRSVYRRLRRLHAPLDIKEKVYRLMNKKTDAYATLEYSTYLLRKRRPVGEAKKELKRNIRGAKKTLRFINADIRHYVKKAEKHHERHRMDIMQTVYFIIALLLCIGGYFLFKNFDAVMAWLKG